MTTIYRISKEFGEDLLLSKLRRQPYAGWKQRVEAAREREKQHREAQAWKQNRI